MKDAGFTLSGSDHPISPVMLGDAKLAAVMADDLLDRGISLLLLNITYYNGHLFLMLNTCEYSLSITALGSSHFLLLLFISA